MDFLACLDDYQYLRQTLAVPLREKILICRDLLASQTCPLLSSVTLQLHHCLICAAVIKRNLKHYVASELDICLIKSHYSISFTSRSYEKISTHIHLVLANISQTMDHQEELMLSRVLGHRTALIFLCVLGMKERRKGEGTKRLIFHSIAIQQIWMDGS